MTTWFHLSTLLGMRLNRRLVLRISYILLLCIALITTLFFGITSHAAPGINQTIGFQGRLLDSNGDIVPDGYYNVQFKIYQDGTGSAAGNPDGTLEWTETYINNGSPTGAVEVKNGFLSVNLGSQNPFGTNVDWNQDTLWLSMNIAGASTSCTTFGVSPCVADGEMLPMKRMTATPFALNAGAVNGKTADNFVHLGQGLQTDSSNNSSIYINKTGSGNMIQLKNNDNDVFTVNTIGELILGSETHKSISIATSGTNIDGKNLTMSAGMGGTGTGSSGGNLLLYGGEGGGTNSNGGNIILGGGAGSGTGTNGLVVLTTPTFSTTTNDANCYTGGTVVATSCTVTTDSLNTGSAIIVGFSATGQTATIPDPSNTTAGRTFYITAANGSKDFTLSINGGGTGNLTTMRQNTTTTLLWNGNDWTIAGASNYAMNSTDNIANLQVGSATDNGDTTVLTLDKANSAPLITDEALLGSMYYDTTLGKIQCYEADGWGACSSAPDTFITLSPEYTNAVQNGSATGTMTSDVCSDTLNINDGSSGQPTVCGTNETYNFYNWTSSSTTAQTKSIYVTYKLPTNFKGFASGATSLMGRTDSSDANVSYQIYRSSSSGLTACGSTVAVSTGVQTTWQSATATGSADPSSCGYVAGESIVIKINLTSANDAHAYVGNLNFVYGNN